jgi:uncharacterized protein (TIGR00304 family)
MVDLVLAGLALGLVGFGVVAVALMSETRKADGEVRGGGVVMIGPIPIIFGSDAKWASVAIAMAIVLVVVALLVNTA